MTLWLGKNKMHFNYTPEHFKDIKKFNIDNINPVTVSKQILNEYNYCASVTQDHHDDFDDVDFSNIFDHDGNWQKAHIHHVIHVLDTFRISHEGYHEIHMVSRGHLPPLHQLIIQKKMMSETIPYIKHTKVCCADLMM